MNIKLSKIIAVTLSILILITAIFVWSISQSINHYNRSTLILPNQSIIIAQRADNIIQKIIGLMGVTQLSKDKGMLFKYNSPKVLNFWMKGTLIPLDIVFFNNEGKIIKMIENFQPCTIDPCKTRSSGQPVTYALEVNAGVAQKNNLAIGDHIQLLASDIIQ